MEDTLIITLKTPIEFNGETFHELNLREPIMDEIEKFANESEKSGSVGGLKLILSLITGIPKPVIGKIGSRDMKKAEKFISSFLDDEIDSTTDGETS
jgi:hypothetical protein